MSLNQEILSSDTDSAPSRNYAELARAYARKAWADKKQKQHCRWVRLAAKRFLDDLKRKNLGYHFDDWWANDACGFIEKLPHVEGEWETPTLRLEPAQIFVLANVFGWRRDSDGKRRFSRAYLETAKKSAKSTLTAGVALYCLCCEDEVGPQVIIGATTGEQAGKVFNPAKRMVEVTPALQEAFDVVAWARSITCGDNGGFIQPINAKGKTQDGWNPHVGILDELHAHPDRTLFDNIDSAFGARKNPLLWIITTAGFNTNGVCYEQRTYLVKVLTGVIEAEHFFGVIYTLDGPDDYADDDAPGDDPFDESKWIKANPLIGLTPSWEDMRSKAADAKASPDAEGNFKTKKLNIWQNAHSAWLNMEKWKACGDRSLDWADFEGLDCWIGADLADKDDITALSLIAYRDDGVLIHKPMFWLPEAVLQQPDHLEGRHPAPYRTWVKDGYLQLTPGDWVDHEEIRAIIEGWLERFAVRKATFDQFAAAQGMAAAINRTYGDGDDPLAVVLHKKASNVTDPAKDLEARVRGGPKRFVHDNNPVMNWMASNVVVSRRRDETILPIKESQMSPNKIDGIDALINAMAPSIFEEAAEPSVYQTGDYVF